MWKSRKKKFKGTRRKGNKKTSPQHEEFYFPINPSPIVLPLSFPQRFRKAKLDGKFATFFNMFKKLEMNIPFADALTQMPKYVKFMKEIMINK